MAFEFPSTKTARKEKAQKELDAKIEKAGKIFDKKLKKLLGSKETQLHADSFEKGNERAESRAVKETMQEFKKMAKGGRAMLRGGGICKKGMNKKAVGKNS